MILDPQIYSSEAVRQYDASRRLHARLVMFGVAFALFAVAAFLFAPGTTSLVIFGAGGAAFVFMLVRVSAERSQARDHLESERRQWMLKQSQWVTPDRVG